ncbi:hypothetical protein E2C01_102760 [Portunus trituberculatus]|uniref:Uncharacterized protein n=1 Tax=Portunus trituberculatus TaxID=210409 RepID=A0A5B7KE32_PORTR|nr:hypothetical protein [Portunus trituberculatus]
MPHPSLPPVHLPPCHVFTHSVLSISPNTLRPKTYTQEAASLSTALSSVLRVVYGSHGSAGRIASCGGSGLRGTWEPLAVSPKPRKCRPDLLHVDTPERMKVQGWRWT